MWVPPIAQALLVQAGRIIQPAFPKIVSWGVKWFPFREYGGPIPLTPLRKPLADCTIALVTTSTLHPKTTQPFDTLRLMGDGSVRFMAAGLGASQLDLSPVRYDSRGIERDINVAYPVSRLLELAVEGVVRGSAATHYGFCGYCPSTKRLLAESLPEVIANLRAEEVDGVVIIPACVMCNQTAPLIARVIEAAGIATITLSTNKRASLLGKPPRCYYVERPCGYPLGRPKDAEGQRNVLRALVQGLETLKVAGGVFDLPGGEAQPCAACVY